MALRYLVNRVQDARTWFASRFGSVGGFFSPRTISTPPTTLLRNNGRNVLYYGRPLKLSSPFSPLDLVWHSAYWAESPSWSAPGDGIGVASWGDASGNGRDVVQATGGFQPIYRASTSVLGNRPSLEFDGSDDQLLSGSSFTATSGVLTKVLVVSLNSTATTRHIWSGGPTGSRADVFAYTGGFWGGYSGSGVITGGTIDTSPHLLIVTYDSTLTIEVDGSVVGTGASATSSLSSHSIGAYSGGEFASMYLAFAGLYSGTLTPSEKASLLSWSQRVYGTP